MPTNPDHALAAKAILESLTDDGDRVSMAVSDLEAIGLGLSSLAYANWLLDNGIRVLRVRNGIAEFGRQWPFRGTGQPASLHGQSTREYDQGRAARTSSESAGRAVQDHALAARLRAFHRSDHAVERPKLKALLEEAAAALDGALASAAAPARPECFARGMDFLGEPEATEIEAYVAKLEDRVQRMQAALHEIAEMAHQHSTGPAVPDVLWSIRAAAHEAL